MSVRRPVSRSGSPAEAPRALLARAPGRVNLIGEHTDYNGGLALPMAINLRTEVTFTENESGRIVLYSAIDPAPASFPVDISLDRRTVGSLQPRGRGWRRPWRLSSDRPGAGSVGSRAPSRRPPASPRAPPCVALALAFGAEGPPFTFAQLGQRAEAMAGSDVGLMDPLVIAGARAGNALLIDFSALSIEAVAIPEDAEIVVVYSGQPTRPDPHPLRRPAGGVRGGVARARGGARARPRPPTSPGCATRCCAGGPATSSPSAAGSATSPRPSGGGTWWAPAV